MPTATATGGGGGGADAAPLRCASSLRMARRLLSTAYRSACSRSRSSRLPARERGAGVQRCQREGRRRAERRGAEGGGAARRAVLRGGGERRLGEHALQLLLLLLRRLQAARRHERSLQFRLLLHLGARGTRQPVAIRPPSRSRRIGPVGHRGERRV